MKKKGKIITMPSTLEAQIRSRARSLAIDKCLINSDWKKSKMAIIVIQRKHVNGTLLLACILLI